MFPHCYRNAVVWSFCDELSISSTPCQAMLRAESSQKKDRSQFQMLWLLTATHLLKKRNSHLWLKRVLTNSPSARHPDDSSLRAGGLNRKLQQPQQTDKGTQTQPSTLIKLASPPPPPHVSTAAISAHTDFIQGKTAAKMAYSSSSQLLNRKQSLWDCNLSGMGKSRSWPAGPAFLISPPPPIELEKTRQFLFQITQLDDVSLGFK